MSVPSHDGGHNDERHDVEHGSGDRVLPGAGLRDAVQPPPRLPAASAGPAGEGEEVLSAGMRTPGDERETPPRTPPSADPRRGPRLGSYRPASSPPGLTSRHLDVLELLADDLTTIEVASTLRIAERTVRNHVAEIIARLGVRSRTGAVGAAYQRGILRPPNRKETRV